MIDKKLWPSELCNPFNGTNPFLSSDVWGGNCELHSNFNIALYKQTLKTLTLARRCAMKDMVWMYTAGISFFKGLLCFMGWNA